MPKVNRLYIKRHKGGFTLVELILVIAILGILASIAVPRLSGFSEKSRIKADEVSLGLLNKMTDLYAITNNINGGDVFAGLELNLETDEDKDKARIQELVDEKFLDKLIKPQQKDVFFKWEKIEEGKEDFAWKLIDSNGNGESGGGETSPPGKTEEEIAEEKAKEKADAIKLAKDYGFTFDEKIEPYTITGYTGSETNLIIPSEIAGVAVTSIAKNAFEWKDPKQKLNSVTIPDSIISIGEYAFKGNNITTITLPKRLTEIEEGIFSRNKLSSLTIPDSVTSIEAYAFDVNELTSVIIGKNVTSIGKAAFKLNYLQEVIILSSNISIDNPWNDISKYAFYQNGPNKSGGTLNKIDGQGTWKLGNLAGALWRKQ